ncbi:hypothetical protein ANCCAN_16462 [Ancylostoma caninum]|uniref:Uncharacterized protein n=1 Tax=Ancylostoma caninum TaxID=29170 RepID=A0A368G3S3_ANCCA|nr:hypothetical protein ANCCAN_16462 [Ancylostoma caninum]
MRVHQTISLVLLFSAVLPASMDSSNGRPSSLAAPSNNMQSRGTRAIEDSKAGVSEPKEHSSRKPMDPAFMKSLNEVLMKFLRDVATVVKESPVDMDKIQEADVSQLLANSLAASIPTGSSNRILPERRLPPKVPANHIVPLETATSLGGGVHRGVEQSLSYWSNGTKNNGESSDSKSAMTAEREELSKHSSTSNETEPEILKRLPVQKMTKYGLDKLKRYRVPSESVQKTPASPKPTPPASLLRHSVQKLNGGITRTLQERSRSNISTKVSGNGLNRRRKLRQNLGEQKRKTSKPLPGTADVIIRKHTTADLTETISRNATQKKTLPIKKLTSPARSSTTVKNRIVLQQAPANSKAKPKQERKTDALRTKQKLSTSQASKISERQSSIKYRAAARPTHSISKWRPAHEASQAHQAQQQHSHPRFSSSLQSHPPLLKRPRSKQNRPSSSSQPASLRKEVGSTPQLQLRGANESVQSRSGREEILNDMLFDLLMKLGVQSFVMETTEGSLRAAADPKQTRFIPLQFFQPSNQRRSESYSTNPSAPYNSRPHVEHNELKVAVRGTLRSAVTTNKTTAQNSSALDSPVFFRNSAGKAIPWRRTAGVTRKELRRLRLKTY